MMARLVPIEHLTYLVGARCPCSDPKCKYKYYQAAMFFGVIRVLMGRN